MKTLRERLESKLAPGENGCLEFTGARDRKGYGQVRIDGRTQYAHRVAWELQNGEIPDGQYVLHKCDVPACCNPEHLFLGTHADNMADKIQKGRAYRVVDETMVIFMKELQMQDLNQAQIGECLGVSQSSVSNYLSGKWVAV